MIHVGIRYTDRGQVPRWLRLLALFLAGILVVLAFREADWKEMLETARQGRFDYLALTCLVLSAVYFMRGLRWRILLSAEKRISPIAVFWATVVGYLGNNLLPARAGELIRSVMIGRNAQISNSYVLATALTERIIDVFALVLISLTAITMLADVSSWLVNASKVMMILGLAAVMGLFVAPHLEGVLKAWLTRLPLRHNLRTHLVNVTEQFLLGMRAFQHPRRALSFAGLTGVIWLTDTLLAVVVARAFGLALAVPEALLLLAALGLSSAAPSTPGYVGIYQFVAVTVLTPFGFSQNEALVYIIALQAVNYLVVIGWGAIGLWRLGAMGAGISWIAGLASSIRTLEKRA